MGTDAPAEPPAAPDAAAPRPPTSSPSPPSARAARVYAAAIALGWCAITWPQLTGAHPAPHARAALLGLAVAGLCAALLAPLGRALYRAVARPPRAAYLTLVALASAALSRAVAVGPMLDRALALDSAVYTLQARALAHGAFGAPMPGPRLAFSSRFLFEGADGLLHGVFPPGYPLLVAPFARLGAPLWAGPAVAALLVVAVYVLARVVTRGDETAARLAPLLGLPSFARAVETADLLSHAFVGALAAFALAATLRLAGTARADRASGRSRAVAAALGACVGWATCARLLDGAVLALVCAALLGGAAMRRAVPLAWVLAALVAAAPFAVLLAAQQQAASGRWTVPSQQTYFVRSDWPPDCHRLGLGATVGCHVEHPGESRAFGPDGYTVDDAVRVGRERAEGLGDDLFSVGALALVALCVAVAWPLAHHVACAAFVLALTLAYGLFYYGNNLFFGARHLFPAAPFLWTLLAAGLARLPGRRSAPSRPPSAADAAPAGTARAPQPPSARWLDATHARGAAVVCVFALIVAGQVPRWPEQAARIAAWQAPRVDVRRAIAHARLERGIFAVRDRMAYLAGFDPWTDGSARVIVEDDYAGLHELRRAHPTLPLYFVLTDQTMARALLPPPRALRVELELAWPTLQRVHGAATMRFEAASCCGIGTAGGGFVLLVFHAAPGDMVAMPFDVARAGTYALRVDGVSSPEFGTWDLYLDGTPLARWDGYAPGRHPLPGVPAAPRALAAGRHVLLARCTGRAPQSAGYLAAFDTLVGEPVDAE